MADHDPLEALLSTLDQLSMTEIVRLQVTGEAVNLAARVAGSADLGEIRLTKEAFRELGGVVHRLGCRSLGQVALKGVSRTVELLALDWRDRTRVPDSVRVRETGEE